MSSIFPSKKIIFTEEKAKGKAIFRYPRTQSVLKELLKVLLQKPKTISLNQKVSNVTKLSKDFSKTKDIIGSDCQA